MEVQNHRRQALAEKIRRKDFSFLSDVEKKSHTKNIIKKCAQKLSLKNVFFKQQVKSEKYLNEESISVKFSCSQEKIAYDFLDKFYQKVTGVVICDLMQILKMDKMKFSVKIDFRIFTINKENKFTGIKMHTKKRRSQKSIPHNICLFPLDVAPHRHTLLCVIGHSRAYVNNRWMKEGDKIDDFRLIHIGEDSIDLKSNKKTLTNIKVGTSWTKVHPIF
jgi:hypothetical protein